MKKEVYICRQKNNMEKGYGRITLHANVCVG